MTTGFKAKISNKWLGVFGPQIGLSFSLSCWYIIASWPNQVLESNKWDYSSRIKNLGNAALNWQPFVIALNTRQMLFLHRFIHQERVKKGKFWKNVLSPSTTVNIRLHHFNIFPFFPGWKKVLRLALQILDSREGVGTWEGGVFQCLEIAPFWLLDRVCTLFPRMLVFGKYFVVVKSLNRKD